MEVQDDHGGVQPPQILGGRSSGQVVQYDDEAEDHPCRKSLLVRLEVVHLGCLWSDPGVVQVVVCHLLLPAASEGDEGVGGGADVDEGKDVGLYEGGHEVERGGHGGDEGGEPEVG